MYLKFSITNVGQPSVNSLSMAACSAVRKGCVHHKQTSREPLRIGMTYPRRWLWIKYLIACLAGSKGPVPGRQDQAMAQQLQA